MNSEKVHTINDWYDGPRLGIADYNGIPHIYKSTWNNEKGDWEAFYYLKPIDEYSFKYALESWEIWKRYEKQFKEGKVGINSHPALPEDKNRHTELEVLLKGVFDIDESSAIKASAKFESDEIEKNKLFVSWGKVE